MLKRLVLAQESPAQGQTVISLTSLGEIGAELRNAGVRVIALQLGKNPFYLLRKLFGLRKILQELRPDVVQTWMYHADLIGGIAARFAGIRNVVWGIRGTYPPIGRPITYLVMKICAVLSYVVPKRVLCVAQSARVSHSVYGYSAKKMAVIPNGLDFRDFTTDRTEYLRELLHLPSTAVLLGSVGRFHPDKAQDLLVSAFLQTAVQFPDVHLVLIGRDCDSANSSLMQLTTGHPAASRIHLLGQRRDIPRCLSGMDMYCMPSRTEGFPNGLAEAMAAGLTVLATDAGDAKMLVSDCGLVIAKNSLNCLIDGLGRLCRLSAPERDELGAKSAQHVRAQYSIDSIRQRYSEFYHNLLEV